MKSDDMSVGFIHQSKLCGPFEIVEYVNSKAVIVRFTKTGFVVSVYAHHVRAGTVKDKLFKSVFGVGCIGVGNHKVSFKRRTTKKYSVWSQMLRRCYSQSYQDVQPTYKGCSVCVEWLNFQAFGDWFDENYIDGNALDKDILIDGNKQYSPSSCLFVTQRDNNIKSSAKLYMFELHGVVTEIYNLGKFCRDNKLNYFHMLKVNSGELKTYCGFKKQKIN